jgi:hypothetical protein
MKRECRGKAPNFVSSRRNVSLQCGHCGTGAVSDLRQEGHFMDDDIQRCRFDLECSANANVYSQPL